MIAPAAHALSISPHRIFANTLLFHPDGSFKGFDETEPTSRAGGKAKVVGMLKEKHKYPLVIMVGDGATDLEARPPADAFVGFGWFFFIQSHHCGFDNIVARETNGAPSTLSVGGVALRKAVQEGADWFVTDMQELIDGLD